METSCLHNLGCTKPPPNIGVSFGVGSSNKLREQKFVQKPTTADKVNGRICRVGDFKKVREQNFVETPNAADMMNGRKLPNGRKGDVVGPNLDCPSSLSDENLKKVFREGRGVKSKSRHGNGAAKYRVKHGNYFEEKREAKTKKWLCYGGCVPSILQSLEMVKDIDEALEPWKETLNNKERSIILKEQLNWERALEIFEWFRKEGYELNVIHYNIILRILGKAQRWDHLERIWDEMETKQIVATNSTYGTLIDVYSKGGLKEESLLWLERMKKQRMEPDEVTMGIVVQTYKRAGEFDKAEQFFKKWSAGKFFNDGNRMLTTTTLRSECQPHACLSSYTYNTLIDTYGKAGHLQEASDTFAQMLREGIVPNTVTFNTMIHISGNHGQLEEATSLVQKMEELRCFPDTRTYNILISLHAKHNNIDVAMSYFANMKKFGLKPDHVSYRTLLYAFSIRHMVREAEALVWEMDKLDVEIDEYTHSALTRMYIEAGFLQKSWAWFERFHVIGKMSSDCYSANIDAYGEHGHILEAEKAFLCCQQMKKLSVLVFNVMIKAYGITRKYDKACQIFDSMEKHGILPDKFSYSSLIQILSSLDLPHLAKTYARKMHEAGLMSDCFQYCAVMLSFVKLGQLEKAEKLFKEMVRSGVQPDIVVYGILINAFANVGNAKEATNYVDEMKTAGFLGNPVIYKTLIKLYTKVGNVEAAHETYKLLQSSDASPELYSSNCMIDLYSEHGMVREAEEIFEGLKEMGRANEFSYSMMLCMYKRLGNFEKAMAVARKMSEVGLLTDILSYNNVIGLYASDGMLQEAAETFWGMIKSGIQPDDSTFRSLGLLLVRCGASKEAISKLEVARRKDSESGLQVWVKALCSMICIDDDTWKSCIRRGESLKSTLSFEI